MKQLVSIVVPIFNEEDNIDVFYQAISEVATQEAGYEFEFVFVDDGSSDQTPQMLEQLAELDSRVRGIILARNFGHQTAITCGMEMANGDAVITMDGDMQHPPALIPDLLRQWEAGYEVVQTIRDTTENVSVFKKKTSSMYYRFLRHIAAVPIRAGGSDFRLISRAVSDTLSRFKEHNRFIRGIIGGIGYRQTTIHFIAPPRFAGTSKFNLRKMVRFAVDGIMGFSRVPLRFALWTGFVMGIFSFCMMLHVLYEYFWRHDVVTGWTTLAIAQFLLGGLSLVGIGILGEYIGRIFDEVKNRPLYWTRAEFGKEKNKDRKK